MRYFNIAGPCNSTKHYMIDAATRLHGVEELIDNEQYFVIHAARQSGKTTYLQDLTRRLNTEGKYYTLYCSLEDVQNITEPERGIPAIINCIKDSFLIFDIPDSDKFACTADLTDYISVLKAALSRICKLLDKPLVILFDDVDCLDGNTLLLFLRQLRIGHSNR
ncbi:MAG: AAA-like domain-containing protein, partial [Bacteroidales bacterium]|nr:AAA-like domain-containing protein [Bacteroidales bacterium]